MTLSPEKKQELMIMGFAYFPEVLNSSQTRYNRFAEWAFKNYNLTSTAISMKGMFSTGEKGKIRLASGQIITVSSPVMLVYQNKEAITECILDTDESTLCSTWLTSDIEDDRIGQWIKLINLRYQADLRLIFNR